MRHVAGRTRLRLWETLPDDLHSELLGDVVEDLIVDYTTHQLLRWVVAGLEKEPNDVSAAREVRFVVIGPKCCVVAL